MWIIISCAMLCIVSWRSQGLVIVKDPCEKTTTKRLALLVEHLEVSSYEFSSFLSCFQNQCQNPFIFFLSIFFITFLIHYCFHPFHHKLSLFSILFLIPLSKLLHFPFHFYFLFLFYWFQNHFSIVFTSSFWSPSPPTTSSFLMWNRMLMMSESVIKLNLWRLTTSDDL